MGRGGNEGVILKFKARDDFGYVVCVGSLLMAREHIKSRGNEGLPLLFSFFFYLSA